MAMLLKRLSRLEAQMDNAIEKFYFTIMFGDF